MRMVLELDYFFHTENSTGLFDGTELVLGRLESLRPAKVCTSVAHMLDIE